MNDFDAFDDAVEEALRRRAGEVPSSPLGYTDVQRRMVQRRRRTATFVTAAVTLPAVVGLGYLAGRRDTAGAPAGAFPGTSFDGGTITTQPLTVPTTTIVGEYMPAGSIFRCQGSPVAQDDVWQYFGYCEYVPPAEPIDPSAEFPTTTTMIEQVLPTTTLPPVTTTVAAQLDPEALADQVLVIDASGGVASMTEVASLLGTVPRYAVVAGRTVDETMVMPLGTEVGAAYELLQRFGVGGFDTWTPDLIATEVPTGVTVALVLGTSGPVGWTP